MKKLLLGSAVLALFAISITLFQISCKKDAVAQTANYTLLPATTSTLGGIIVGSGLNINSSGVLSTTGGLTQQNKILFVKTVHISGPTYSNEIWTAKYDGTQQQKIIISLPTGYNIGSITGSAGNTRASLSPDGNTVFFNVDNTTTNKNYIYSCNIDGSNVRQLVDGSSVDFINLAGAY